MKTRDNVVSIDQGWVIHDPLTDILRNGARKLLAEAVEAEVEDFINRHKHIRDLLGRQVIVRNGYLPEREIQTGIGPVPVICQRKDTYTSGLTVCISRLGWSPSNAFL